MKVYIATTGTLFGVITLAHILRMTKENPRLATNPWYILITVVAAALCVWACLLLRPKRP